MYDLPHPLPQKAFVFLAPARVSIGGIIKFPIDKEKAHCPYSELVCTDQDAAKIHEIITTVADSSKLSLAIKKTHLERLGFEIDHGHPLKFRSTICSAPRLKDRMYEIFSDFFKRTEFMRGLEPKLTKEKEQGRLMQYAEDFANEIDVPVEGVTHFFHCQDWENFVRYLMKQ